MNEKIYIEGMSKEEFLGLFKVAMLEETDPRNLDIYKYIIPDKVLYRGEYRKTAKITKGSFCVKRVLDKKFIHIASIESKVQVYILSKEGKCIDYATYAIKLIIAICDMLVIGKIDKIESALRYIDYAIEKDVMIVAVPGEITDKSSYVANLLIRQGARVACSKYDIKCLV